MGGSKEANIGDRRKHFHDILRVRSIVEMPRLEIFEKLDRYPNKYFPSDHFSLVVEFEFNFWLNNICKVVYEDKIIILIFIEF